MTQARAYAKINLALVVGPVREDAKHEVVTILQRIDLHDDIELESADELVVEGFAGDTIVREALEALALAANVEPRWRVRIEKRIPVTAGLGGGSSDAAAALELANRVLATPLPREQLHEIAAGLGADVPFFLCDGPQVGTGVGTTLTSASLPGDYHVVIVVPNGATKSSTRAVYEAFDARGGPAGFDARAERLRGALAAVTTPHDLAALPPNDLEQSSIAGELALLGAFRADVSGAGPSVYGLFDDPATARRAADALARDGQTIVTRPVAR